MATTSSLHQIECSDQPLDLSFHPQQETLVAAALVDGTLEVHDFRSLLTTTTSSAVKEKEQDSDSDSDDEDDTILSSTPVHQQSIPDYINGNKSDKAGNKLLLEGNQGKVKRASCRAVHFGNSSTTSTTQLYTGGSAGDLCCIDAERVCSFSSSSNTKTKSTVVWRIDSATVGPANAVNNPIHVLHQLPECSSKGNLIVSGDDHGGVRLWDDRLCSISTPSSSSTSSSNNKRSNTNTNTKTGGLQLPQGCVLSWKENQDYISAIDHSNDGHTLLASSADGSLTIFDIRKASTSNILSNSQKQSGVLKQSDPQDDELLSMVTLKQGRKVVCGTQEGVLAMWSWNTWGDISDRYPNAHNGNSIDAMLKLDEDTLITGSSDGLVRIVSLHPNKVIGALGEHDGFPIESMQYTATRGYVGTLSHDNYIRLWDTSVLLDHDNDDDDDDDDANGDDEEMNGNDAGVARPAGTARPITAGGGQESDDDWDDMDEDDDEQEGDDDDDDDEEDMKAPAGVKNSDDDDDEVDSDDSGDDDDDDDDGADGGQTTNDSRANRLKSKNDSFFADL